MRCEFREYVHHGKRTAGWYVYCPACRHGHRFFTESENPEVPIWTFDGNTELPTFDPSLLVTGRQWVNGAWQDTICHSYLKNGVWMFLGDCTHELAGQHVPMINFPDTYRV